MKRRNESEALEDVAWAAPGTPSSSAAHGDAEENRGRSGGASRHHDHIDVGPDRSGGGSVATAPEVGVALEARGVTCAAGRRVIVADATFSIRAGETIGIVGPNGGGKTTLLHVLAGLDRPKRGQVVVDGRLLHGLSPRQRARAVALVAQDERPPADLRAGEVVLLGRTPYLPPWGAGSAQEQHAVEAALATVDLAGFAQRPVHRLSGGERQRVLLARALVQDTPLLLLDEPTNHLDITHQLDLLALARTLDRTIVMALHDLSLADRYCDRILVLHKGRAHPLEPPETALRPEVVDDVFGLHAIRIPHPDTGESHLLITPREAHS
ncbi:ABC transporter ATP-binding protein [Nocardia sp. NPDC051463]|uniref:ABC transporter ATP-binding protein n=1 Tax=Nocardia sp. NPDC051463 TaxID=3154845 RepID=UPI00344F98C1